MFASTLGLRNTHTMITTRPYPISYYQEAGSLKTGEAYNEHVDPLSSPQLHGAAIKPTIGRKPYVLMVIDAYEGVNPIDPMCSNWSRAYSRSLVGSYFAQS